MDIGATGKELFKELARRARVIVVVVHLPKVGEERLHGLGRDAELLDHNPCEVRAVEGRPDIEIRVNKTDVAELMNTVGDLLGPVAPGRFDHPMREAVQGDIEDMAAGALKESRQPAELVMVLEQQDLPAELGEVVRGRHPAQTGANDDGVVAREQVFERRRHRIGTGRKKRAEGKAETCLQAAFKASGGSSRPAFWTAPPAARTTQPAADDAGLRRRGRRPTWHPSARVTRA